MRVLFHRHNYYYFNMKSRDEILDYLDHMGIEDAMLLNDSPIDFSPAFVGTSNDDRVVYSYLKLCECVGKTDKNLSFDEVLDYVDYNIISFLPQGEKAPIILYDYE